MEYTKDEWRELTRPLWPDDWTDGDFECAWQLFLDELARRQLH